MTTQLNLLQRDWCEQMEEHVKIIFGRWNTFTSDDLHKSIEEPHHHNWYGVLMARMKNKGLVERVGYQPSKRPEANGRPIAIWKIKSTASA